MSTENPLSQGLAKFGLCLWRQIILLWIFLKSSATIPCEGTRHHHITIFWALVIISSTQYFDRDIKLSEEFVHFLNSIPTRNHFTYAVRFRKLQTFSLATILDLGYKDPYFRFLEFSPIIHRVPLMKHLRGVGPYVSVEIRIIRGRKVLFELETLSDDFCKVFFCRCIDLHIHLCCIPNYL